MTKAQRKISAQPKTVPGRYFSRAIANALRVLEFLQLSEKPVALSDISRQLDLPKSSAFRILRTLESASYIQRTQDDRFSIAHGAGFMPSQMREHIVSVSQSALEDLSREFRETISLALLFDNRIEVVKVISSPHRISMGNTTGDLIPPHASSLGKCITAFQPEARRAKLLRTFSMIPFTANTITEEPALYKEFERVRARGYATDHEESVVGGCCVSAPIFSGNGQAIAAISISMPKMRFTRQERLIAAIRKAAAGITSELGSHS